MAGDIESLDDATSFATETLLTGAAAAVDDDDDEDRDDVDDEAVEPA